MKKPLLFLTFLLSQLITSHAQQWHLSLAPYYRNINSVEILSNGKLFIAGGNEYNDSIRVINSSDNGGLSWWITDDSLSSWMKSIDFADDLHGMCAGYNGRIRKTSNGGTIWTGVHVPLIRHYNKVFYKDAQNVFLAGGYQSNDSIQTILKSTNGGTDFSVVYDQQGYWLKSLAFADANNGVAVGEKGTILRTTDGGNNWSPVVSPLQRDFNSVTFSNATTGFIVGGHLTTDSIRTILKTTDAGASWTIVLDEQGYWLTDVSFLNQDIGYIAGYHATFMKTINGGDNWTTYPIDNAYGTEQFTSVKFLNEGYGIIGGRTGYNYVFSGGLLAEVQTLEANLITSVSANLLGTVNTHGIDAEFSFIYDDNSALSSPAITGYPDEVNSNFTEIHAKQIQFLVPNTTYYYCAKVRTLAGTVYGDTLSFFTGNAYSVLETSPAVSVTGSSATLKGHVSGFAQPANLYFQYDTTTFFTNEIATNPSSINDNAEYIVSTPVNFLQPEKVYYFRIKAVTANGTYYGEPITFYTGTLYTILQTISATNITDTSAVLNGMVSGFTLPAVLSFEYTQSQQNSQITLASPENISDALPHSIMGYLNNISPISNYSFRIKAQTALGVFYGQQLYFNSGSPYYNEFATKTATEVNLNSAKLNGTCSHLNDTTTITFQYGLTEAFGNEVALTLGQVNDTLQYNFSKTISNLIPDTFYFYRLKGVTQHGIELFGYTKVLYTGLPEIPNWDFQEWNDTIYNVAAGWNLATDDMVQEAGNTGNYALKIYGRNIAINGEVGGEGDGNGPGFGGGIPFNFRPDSISVFLNYYVEPGDTMFMLAYMHESLNPVAFNFYPITGNSGNQFVKKTFALGYDSPFMPDSLVIGFVTTNPFSVSGHNYLNNYLIIDDISFSPQPPEILFGGFETWITYPHNSLRNWSYMKFFGITSSTTESMVTQVPFSGLNDYAAEIKNVERFGKLMDGSIGTSSGFINEKESTIALSAKHYTFNGYYKYYPVNGDTAKISATLTKSGVIVGQAEIIVTDSVTEFTVFDAPVLYMDTIIPDSAFIKISVSNRKARGLSSLVIDKICFDGIAGESTDTTGIEFHSEKRDVIVYPNPANSVINIEFAEANKEENFVTLFDMDGRAVLETIFGRNQNKLTFDVSGVRGGFYILKISNKNNVFTRKVIITR